MSLHRIITIPFFFLMLLPVLLFGQKTDEYYNWFDTQTGVQNLQVFNGTAYTEKYRTINEKHKFLNSSNFLPGSVIYEGQPYFELELKYDLYEDELLLNSKNGKGTVLIFNRDKVNSFIIDSRKFIHPNQSTQDGIEISGFYEVLLETSFFTFLKKNRKDILKNVRRELVYYEFKSSNKNYIFYKNSYYPLNKKRDFLRIFPEFKKSINSYYKTSRNTSDTDFFMKSLLRNLERELLTQQSGSIE